jgi:predicted permease
MDWLRILMSRCSAFFKRAKLDGELDEELRAHIALAMEENVAHGMSEADARTAALRSFGGVAQTRETYRVQRGMPWVEQMGRDVRFGIRQLRRSPGFALTAILTLALGLGANTAVFSLINALLLRPLPVPHADQLAVLHINHSDDVYGPDYNFCAPMFRALEKRHDGFQDVFGFSGSTMQVRTASGNVTVYGAMVSGQFFHAMQVAPLMGRYLTPVDDQRGGGSGGFAVVISEGLWRTWFNSSPDVIGHRLTIANAPFTIVGVMPKTFIGADPTQRPQLYTPMWAEPVIDAPYDNIAGGHHSLWISVIGRRNPDASLEQAQAALQAVSNSLVEETSEGDAKWLQEERAHRFQLNPEPGANGYSYLRRAFRKPLAAVFTLCVAMLLLSCLNLASLLMARSAARERELATRLAMGATRGRLIRQLLVESLLIAVLGTAAGMAAAPLISKSLAVFVLRGDQGATLDTALDLRVFLFVCLIAMIATVLIGLVPALRATSKNLNEQIKSGSQSTTARQRNSLLPRLLMGFEVALALILVVGAGLLATSLSRLYRTGLGFEPKGLAKLELDTSKQSMQGDVLVRWYRAYGDALRHQPGVRSVSFAAITPLSGSLWSDDFHTPISNGEREVYLNTVSPEYFQSMRISILSGRDFNWNDTAASGNKIILGETAARYLFPGQNAVGQRVAKSKDTYEVIAVVRDIHYVSIKNAAPAEGYMAMTQSDDKKPSYMALVRIDGPAASFAAAARALTAKMAPDIPAPVMTTMSSQLDASISSERMMAMLAVFFAVCALLVTAIGLYGTLAYATARRTSEIGIRMALGARRAQVVGMVFRENAWVAAGGSAAGLVIAVLASRVLATFLYGTSVRDPWIMFESVAVLAVIASAASLVPAMRAARVDPIVALRSE